MRRVHVPAALGALLAVALVLGVTWTLAVPPFQQPDEPDHVARVQRTAEGVGRPPNVAGNNWSTQEANAVYGTDALRVIGNPAYGMPWSTAVDAQLRIADRALEPAQRRDMNGLTIADSNPSGYYRYASLVFRLGGDFFTRLWITRLGGVLALLATVAGAWLLAGEVFRDRRLQVVAAGVVAMEPMVDSISTAVTPDGLLITLTTLALWLTVRVLRRGLTWPGVAGLVVAVALACLVKTPGYALIPAAGTALAIALVRARRPDLRLTKRTGLVGAAVVAAVLLVLYGLLRTVGPSVAPQLATAVDGLPDPKRFGSYLWQFYLGRPGFLTPTPNLGTDNRFGLVWVKQAWGLFGALDTPLPAGLYTALLWAGWLSLAGAIVALVRRRRSVDAAVVAVLALAAGVMLLGLHITEFRILIANGGPFLVGRYILPLVGLGGLVAAAAVAALPLAWRSAGAGVVLAGSLGVQLVALDVVLLRFYAA